MATIWRRLPLMIFIMASWFPILGQTPPTPWSHGGGTVTVSTTRALSSRVFKEFTENVLVARPNVALGISIGMIISAAIVAWGFRGR